MKILVVCQYYYPEPFRVTDICEELVRRGNQVTVLTGLPNYPEGKILKEYKKKEHRDEIRNGVRVIRCNEHGRGHNAINMLWNYFSFAISGMRKIKKLDKDFDLVFINQLSPVMMAWPGIKYAKKYKKKSILYCYDLWPASLAAGGIKQKSLFYNIFKMISRKVYNQVDHICVTSKSFIDYLMKEHKVKEEKISYLPQYCESIFENIENCPHDEYNFVFAGNIGKAQSVETIIKAANLLKNNDNIKIHIVGDGRDLSLCKKLAESFELQNVIFYGRRPVEEMNKYYSMADAMIVTLTNDVLLSFTLPGKVQSYMAAHKAIIGAINGETSRIIHEAKCGLTCKANDFNGLANIMSKMEKKEITVFGENAFEFYSKNFSANIFYSKIEEVFKEQYEK